jgi:hypothetical protein
MFRKPVLFIIISGLSFFCEAQSLTSRMLLNNLEPFWEFVEDLRQDLKKSTGNEYKSVLKQSGYLIELELIDSTQKKFLRVQYGNKFSGKLIRYNFYCADKKLSTQQLEADADQMVETFEWDSLHKKHIQIEPETNRIFTNSR